MNDSKALPFKYERLYSLSNLLNSCKKAEKAFLEGKQGSVLPLTSKKVRGKGSNKGQLSLFPGGSL